VKLSTITHALVGAFRALAKLLNLDPRKVEDSFKSLEPYLETAAQISQAVALATGNKTVAEAIAFAESKGLPVVEAWLHTNDENLGTVLLQIGAQLLLKQFPALTRDDATTAIQNAQRAIRTLEAPAKS
jgi:hypothetical protein